jgi:molybdate transport system substrate-binding protein
MSERLKSHLKTHRQGYLSRRRWLAAAFATGAGAAIGAPQAEARSIKIAAASSVADVARSIGQAFEKVNPGVSVVVVSGGSDQLVTQLVAGNNVDVLITADEISMSRAIVAGKIAKSTVRIFARNELVLASKLPITRIEQLQEDRFKRIAIGNPVGSPSGRYARDALSVAGVWSEIERKVVFAQNARYTTDYIAKGVVDAAVVYRSELLIKGADQLVQLPMVADIAYPIAPIVGSASPLLAQQFVQMALSEPMRVVLKSLRFELP